jgi:hypothetical protein
LEALRLELGDYIIDVVAHSQGNMMVSEALRPPTDFGIDGYVLSQAAVSVSAYDANPDLIDPDVAKRHKVPPPDWYGLPTPRFGGLSSSVRVIRNFANCEDKVLETWRANNVQFKPDRSPKPGGGRYGFEASGRAIFVLGKNTYEVTEEYEKLAFVALAKTKTLGASEEAAGVIPAGGGFNMRTDLGFDGEDHSGQFDRSIQDLNEYYRRIMDLHGPSTTGRVPGLARRPFRCPPPSP